MGEKKYLWSLSYRSELLQEVMAILRTGECCSLIGTSGMGKSNLARFLQRQDVQQHYWGDEPAWMLVLDSQSFIFEEGKSDYVVLEAMVQGLLSEAEQRQCPAEFLQEAGRLHALLLEKSTTTSAFFVLQRLCKLLCEQQNVRVIFIFDQFDDIWQNLQARFFLNLRSLRDQFKYQLGFLVMTRDRLRNGRVDANAVEAFWELFSAHTYGLGLCNQRDSSSIVEQLAARANSPVSPTSLALLMQLSGCHPGLLRALFWALLHEQWSELSVAQLLQIPSIHEECKKIWETLSSIEQPFVQLLARQSPSPAQSESLALLAELRLKGVVCEDTPALFSPIFVLYVLQLAEDQLSGVSVDSRKRQIRLDGQLIDPPLSALEFKLLEYLAKHAEEVCHTADLLRELYNDEVYTKNDQRLYALLTRVRKVLGETAQQPRYIVTHHGGGVQLLKGRIADY